MAQTHHKNQVQASAKSATRGRPKLYDADYMPRTALVLCRDHGFTQKQLARVFGIATITLKKWLVSYPEFKEAVIRGRNIFDSNVVEKELLKAALGYEYEEKQVKNGFDKNGNQITDTTIFTRYEPPNLRAISFFLCNRTPERYSYKHCQ
jgi:hypothetical protein